VCSESEDADLILVGFVELGNFFSKFIFGAIWAAGVKNVPAKSEVSNALVLNPWGRWRSIASHTRPSVSD
jgi:hypothetical protein